MALPSSGPLSLTDIQTEFGGTNPIGLSEYYAGGGLVPAGTTGTYGAVPSSGTISIQNFYGTANYYTINNSLRLRGSATGYLSRTPGSASSTTTWTWSAWVKRGSLGGFQRIFNAINAGNNTTIFEFNSSDKLHLNLQVAGSNVSDIVTTQVFRDPSAWYHFVFTWDTTNATAANRIRMYVNGSQITAFDSASYPAQNYSGGFVNTINPHYIGGNSSPMDGYVAEVNFVNAQALTPSSFGATNSATGVWQPVAYTGTYGTNGFYLKFSNIALTSGSNTGLGQDFSGNGNFWNTNNISVTSGTTYDAMTDSPTPVSATVGNYAVLNPLDNGGNTLSAGNLNVAGGVDKLIRATFGMSSGKWYCEVTITAVGGSVNIGIANSNASNTSVGNNANSWAYNNTGVKVTNASGSAYGATYTTNDIIGIAFDADTGSLTFYKNNVSQGVAFTGLTSGPYFIAFGSNAPTLAFNFGQRPFVYTPPTGFNRLNTYNLATSTIVKGNSYMDATLYTGNGGTQSVTNAASFKPDFLWIKRRDASAFHHLQNSSTALVSGVYPYLSSNSTSGNQNDTPLGVTAINSNGFTVVDNGAGNGGVNGTSQTFVGWQWNANNGTTSSNTQGSITSTVQANTTAGFSIVTYTGNGVAGATFGHGLGVAPKMIAFKARSLTNNWGVWHTSLGVNGALNFNTTAAVSVQNAYFNGTLPTSTLVTVGTDNSFNSNGATYVAYCWAEIAGFSKFDKYTGNGSTDGPFVYTGFRPKFVMTKRTDALNDWNMFDAGRNLYNATNNILAASLSNAEFANDANNPIDFLSNGFKLRGSNAGTNASGGTYIYMAFAENPFKNANAR